jgi:outer membrane protein OmpA-like peptidoglycan-associated protein
VYSQKFRTLSRVLALALVAALPCSLAAQVVASQAKGNPNAPAPKWDIFAGYSVLDPFGTFYPIQPDGTVLPVSFKIEKTGLLESASYFFNRNVGISVESGQHDLFTNTGFALTGASNSGILTLASGLIYRWPGVHLTPFVHALGGAADVDGPDHEPYTWGPVIVGGGGLDWYFSCHFGIRVFEADYEYIHVNSGPSSGTLAGGNFVWGDDENINALRLAAGLVVRGKSAYSPDPGCGPLPPPALACIATPSSVFPGEPVTVTATASGLNPKQTATYSWSGTPASANGNVATVATDSLAPGTYTVQARVTEGSKAVQSADCGASFIVNRWEPPTLTCAVGPMTINPDQTGTITLNGSSPQNLPLTYACTSKVGSVQMNGNTATFSPAGAPAGPVTINCTVADDKGNTSAADCALTIQQPPPPPSPHVNLLCSIDFGRDTARPTRVDNEAKACLDGIALNLQQHPDDSVVVVGEATGPETQQDPNTAAQRAVNTKEYLTVDQGIDPSRIVVVTGGEGTQAVEDYLIPQGAMFNSDVQGTIPVDETVVKPQERKPLPMRSHAAHHHVAVATPAAAGPAGTAAPAGTTKPAGAKRRVHHKKKSTRGKKPAGAAPSTKDSTGP